MQCRVVRKVGVINIEVCCLSRLAASVETAVGILQQARIDTHRTLTMQAMPLPCALPLSSLSAV